jgi:hypothetical protein
MMSIQTFNPNKTGTLFEEMIEFVLLERLINTQ